MLNYKTYKNLRLIGNPLVQEQYTEHKSTISENSLPKLLFMGRFGLTPAMFEEGLATGEFYEIDAEDGKKRYAWTESSKSTTHGSSSSHRMEASKQLNKSQAAVENAKFATWSSNLFHAAFVSGSNQKALPAGPSSPLALEDMDRALDPSQWEQAKSNLSEAMLAFEIFEKDAKKLLTEVDSNGDELYVSLWLGFCLLQIERNFLLNQGSGLIQGSAHVLHKPFMW